MACAQLSSMLLLLFMHALLLIWASAVVVSVYFKVDASSGDHVSVNEALEVYGQAHGPNPYDLLGQGYAPQAHIRIASHSSKSDEKVSD